MSDQGSNGGDILIVPAKGGKARNVTPGLKATPARLAWPAQGRLLFTAVAGSDTVVSALEPERGAITALWRGPERLTAPRAHSVGLSLARDGVTSAVVRETFTQPPEVYAGPIGGWTALSHRNEGVKSPAVPACSLTWKSGGMEIQGWLVAPPWVPPGTRRR